MLSECCLWRQHSNNFGCELQTYPRFPQKKFLANVVWMLSLETTLRQHWDNIRAKEVFFAFFWLEINVFGLWKRSGALILSECCLWRQHWDNIETTFGQKKCFSFFLARNKCFRPLKKVKNTYFVRMLSLETTFRQHSLICCELQTCPVFLSTKCVLCQCCLNVVSRGGI